MLFENFAVHPHRRGMAMASVTGSMNRIWPKWFRITFKTRCTGSTASNAFFFSCGAHSESFWPSHEKTWYPAAANEEATWSNCPERDVHRAPDRPVSSYSSNLYQILILICHVGFTPCCWAKTCNLEDMNLFYCPLQCCLCRSSVQRCTFIEDLSVIPHPLIFPPLWVQGGLWVNNPIRLSLQSFNFCQKTLWDWRVGI